MCSHEANFSAGCLWRHSFARCHRKGKPWDHRQASQLSWHWLHHSQQARLQCSASRSSERKRLVSGPLCLFWQVISGCVGFEYSDHLVVWCLHLYCYSLSAMWFQRSKVDIVASFLLYFLLGSCNTFVGIYHLLPIQVAAVHIVLLAAAWLLFLYEAGIAYLP